MALVSADLRPQQMQALTNQVEEDRQEVSSETKIEIFKKMTDQITSIDEVDQFNQKETDALSNVVVDIVNNLD